MGGDLTGRATNLNKGYEIGIKILLRQKSPSGNRRQLYAALSSKWRTFKSRLRYLSQSITVDSWLFLAEVADKAAGELDQHSSDNGCPRGAEPDAGATIWRESAGWCLRGQA